MRRGQVCKREPGITKGKGDDNSLTRKTKPQCDFIIALSYYPSQQRSRDQWGRMVGQTRRVTEVNPGGRICASQATGTSTAAKALFQLISSCLPCYLIPHQ